MPVKHHPLVGSELEHNIDDPALLIDPIDEEDDVLELIKGAPSNVAVAEAMHRHAVSSSLFQGERGSAHCRQP
jgi:hypothetical protein